MDKVLDFNLFRQQKLGELKKKKENLNIKKSKVLKSLLFIMFFLIIFPFIIVVLIPKFFPNLSYANFILLIPLFSFGLMFYLVYKYSKDESSLRLTVKEEILYCLCEAKFYLDQAHQDKSLEKLNKSLSFFSECSNLLYPGPTSDDTLGFGFENEVKEFEKFSLNFSLFSDKYLSEILQINLSDKECLRIQQLLLELFCLIQKEDFTKMNDILSIYIGKYKGQKASAKEIIIASINRIKSDYKIIELIRDLLTFILFFIIFYVIDKLVENISFGVGWYITTAITVTIVIRKYYLIPKK